jgi:hypothetical protein
MSSRARTPRCTCGKRADTPRRAHLAFCFGVCASLQQQLHHAQVALSCSPGQGCLLELRRVVAWAARAGAATRQRLSRTSVTCAASAEEPARMHGACRAGSSARQRVSGRGWGRADDAALPELPVKLPNACVAWRRQRTHAPHSGQRNSHARTAVFLHSVSAPASSAARAAATLPLSAACSSAPSSRTPMPPSAQPPPRRDLRAMHARPVGAALLARAPLSPTSCAVAAAAVAQEAERRAVTTARCAACTFCNPTGRAAQR